MISPVHDPCPQSADALCATCEWPLPAEHEVWHTRLDGEDACSRACCDDPGCSGLAAYNVAKRFLPRALGSQ